MKKRSLGDPHYPACPVEAYGSFLCKCDEIFAFHNEARVAELETAARALLRRLVRQGQISNHGHRKRGTGCVECREIYALADAAKAELGPLPNGEPDVAPPSESAPPTASDDGGWNDATRANFERSKERWDALPPDVRELVDDAYECGVFMGKIEAEREANESGTPLANAPRGADARVTDLEAWLATIRAAAHSGDVSKNVVIMTGRALAGEPAGKPALALLRAYRARGPKTAVASVSTPSPVPNEDMLEELRKHGMITRQPSGGVLTWMMHEAGVDKLHERFPFTDEHRAALKAFAALAPIPATRPCPHVTIMVNGACLACGVVPTGSTPR